MPGTAIGTSLNSGYLGGLAKGGSIDVAARLVIAYYVPINFGDAVMLNSSTKNNIPPNTVSSLSEWMTMNGQLFNPANFAGFAYREVKQYETYIGSSVPPTTPTVVTYQTGTLCDYMKKGVITLACRVGTPSPSGPVYLRFALNSAVPAGIIGGVEAVPDGPDFAYSALLQNCRWYDGVVDANGCSSLEILYPLCS